MRFLDGGFDLCLHLIGQIVRVFKTHAPRINQLEVASSMFDQRHQTVARNPSAIIDDRQAAACQPIENTAFADIRTADDGDAREAHKLRFPSSSIVQGQFGV
jgi:hypothetical protein